MSNPQYVPAVVPRLEIPGTLTDAAPFGNGHINTTYLLSFLSRDSGSLQKYILQQINTQVFQEPEHLMENIFSVCTYLRQRVLARGGDPEKETLTLVPFSNGEHLLYDNEGRCWRCYRYVENSVSYDFA